MVALNSLPAESPYFHFVNEGFEFVVFWNHTCAMICFGLNILRQRMSSGSGGFVDDKQWTFCFGLRGVIFNFWIT